MATQVCRTRKRNGGRSLGNKVNSNGSVGNTLQLIK
jgi:hypothetical protein